MYGISPEEFFMYLIIALVIIIPVSVRIYRMISVARLKAQLRKKAAR